MRSTDSIIPWTLQSPVRMLLGEGVGLVRGGLGRRQVWYRLTSGEGGGEVDLGDRERCKGEELVRVTGWIKPSSLVP